MKFKCKNIVEKVLITLVFVQSFFISTYAQDSKKKQSFYLSVQPADKDSLFNFSSEGLQNSFINYAEALAYVKKLPQLLAGKGYPAASIDSFWSVNDTLNIILYAGKKYNWVSLNTKNVEAEALNAAGYSDKNYTNKPINFGQVQVLQQRLLNYYEKTGYPFATVLLDSIVIADYAMSANLQVDRGVLYHIDSTRLYGKIKLKKSFLQRYLGIPNGSIYNKEQLNQVDKKLLELSFLKTVQPADLTMLGTGAVLNVYAEPKKSSQVNFLVGFLPAAGDENKLQLTGDVNLNLKNMFAGGEEILLKWQQLQPKSPRLNLGFSQPFILNSPFGFDFLFGLFKKDSNFLQVNGQLGLQYNLSARQSGKLFVQWQNNSLLEGGVDTNLVILQKQLPPNVDVNSANVGFDYTWQATDYLFNPRKGNELNLVSLVGIKNIKKNTDITNLKDPSYNYNNLYDSVKPRSYQLKLQGRVSHYFPLTKTTTLKTAFNGGYYTSPNIFRNELFQIGGYRLLRGFNEESIYAARYAVLTAEYRYLLGLNSLLFVFSDLGWVKNKYQSLDVNNQFISGGIGMTYETKAGLLNISFAIGKRDDVKFNIREASKIHFGYVNYF